MNTSMLKCARVQLSVIGALLMRDIRTRFGRSHIAYLFALVMPVGHVVVTTTIWLAIQKPVPVGDSALIFFSVTMVPFIVWSYPQRQIALAILVNRPLMYFPRVKIPDIMLARSILEMVTAFVAVCCVLVILAAAGETLEPKDPFMLLSAILIALYFGVAMGMFNALIVGIWPGWTLGTALLSMIGWASCGSIFMIEAVPSPYREWLAANPLLQCVEWARVAYYWDYTSSVLDRWYPIWLSSSIIALVLLLERLIRGRVLQG